ncbi:MAG: SH3 domain-containing protein [Dysgonamonadaceae bacterium]
MELTNKYKELIDIAKQYDITVSEIGNVLKIDGVLPSADIKNKMWEIYDKIDPNFRSGDLILDVKVSAQIGGKVKVITQSGNLNIRKGPGTDQPIVGKAAHHDIITLVGKANEQWWLVRDNDGEEGYAFAQYLEPVRD